MATGFQINAQTLCRKTLYHQDNMTKASTSYILNCDFDGLVLCAIWTITMFFERTGTRIGPIVWLETGITALT